MGVRPEDTSAQWLPTLLRQGYLIVSIVLVGVGLLLLQAAGGGTNWPQTLGSTFLATGLLGAMWQVAVDRWQTQRVVESMRGVLRETNPAYGLQQTRVGDIQRSEFEAMMGKATEVSAVCLYDSRWREIWRETLDALVQRGGTFRLCAPDPDDLPLMAQLAARHDMAKNPHEFQSNVRQLLDLVCRIGEGRPQGQVQVRTCGPPGPSYTAYLFSAPNHDGAGITRMYDHRMDQGHSLTEQTFQQLGLLFQHFLRDYDALWHLAKPYPPPPPANDPGRSVHVGVIGPADVSEPVYELAEEVGRRLAERSIVVVCGGLGGVMEAAAKGAARVDGGKAVGILPGLDPAQRNSHVTEWEPTGKGEARDFVVVDRSDALIALGCNPGTLIEAAYARGRGKRVFSIGFWGPTDATGHVHLTTPVEGPAQAVEAALEALGVSAPVARQDANASVGPSTAPN